MSSRVSKINFCQPNAQIYDKRIHIYLDDGEIEKISIPYLENDIYEKNNNKVQEIKNKTALSAFLGGGIGFFISRNKIFLSKVVITSIGILMGIGISAYNFAKNLTEAQNNN